VRERRAQPAVQRGEVLGLGDEPRGERRLDVREVAVGGDQVEVARAAAELAEHPRRRRQQRGGVFHRVAGREAVVPVLDRSRRQQLVGPLVLGEERDGEAGLRVEVDQQHPLAPRGEARAQVGGKGGLADPTLVVDDRDDLHPAPSARPRRGETLPQASTSATNRSSFGVPAGQGDLPILCAGSYLRRLRPFGRWVTPLRVKGSQADVGMDIVWSSMSSASRSAVSSPATWPRPGIATNRARPSAAASTAAAGGGWTGSAGASTTSVGTVTAASSAPRDGTARWVCAVTGSSVPAWAIARSWRARKAAASNGSAAPCRSRSRATRARLRGRAGRPARPTAAAARWAARAARACRGRATAGWPPAWRTRGAR